MIDDLPTRLRAAFERKRYSGGGDYDPDFDLFDAAADEIERLRAVAGKAIEGVSFSDIRPTNYTPANVELRGGFKTK